MIEIAFPDKCVSYDTFMNDLASRIAEAIHAQRDMPDYLSQRKAFETFGRRNVTRWERQGKLHPRRRPGKIEYPTGELRLAQKNVQEYFK
jgi:hypothetical protein